MLRRTRLVAVLLLVIAASSVALTRTTGVATAAATGKVTVIIRTPSGVPANVILRGPRRELFAKPASGTSKSVSRQVPPGSYRVRPQAVVAHGVLYQSPNHQTVTVAAGGSVGVTVRYARVPSASSLHATKITKTSISLAWSAPAGATFSLRRTAGTQPAASRLGGVRVPVTGHAAVDAHLKPGKRYAYALFTHLDRRWAGPITLLAGTKARAGSKTASFTAAPGTVLPAPAQVSAAAPTGSGVTVKLGSAIATPVIGSAVVLPQLTGLPSGYIGQVSGISADGSTVTLRPAGLGDAFSYYSVNVAAFTTGATALRPAVAHPGNHASAGSVDCSGSSSGTIAFSPSLRLDGSFHATINTTRHFGIPEGASISMALTATVTGAMSAKTTASASCAIGLGRYIKTLTLDPVPISVYFKPKAEISIGSALEESNLGVTVTGGVQFSGTIGVSSGAHFSGSHILTAQPLTPQVTQSGSVGVKLGGQLIVGPGAGTKKAGVIAGLSGELDPLDATFGPVFPQNDPPCLKAKAELAIQAGLTAKAWMPHWSIERTITFSALQGHWPYARPWYFPDNCEHPALTVNGGTLPDGQVSTHYDQSLPASGGTQPYQWAVTDGSLPPGITLSDTGELTGTPISQGTYLFTAQVTDQAGATATGTFSLTVNPAQTAPDAISEYDVSPDLDCAMSASGDTSGEFYGGYACGTIISVGGQLYGPADIPAGTNLTGSANYNAWNPTGQTTTGSGVPGDPFVITTNASADGSPITVSQTDTYTVGGSSVDTATKLDNSSGSAVQVTVYHGFDCYPGDSDTGTGTASGGSVSCVSDNVTSSGARTLRLDPGTGGSAYVEEYYGDLWSDIATGTMFGNTVRADDHDTAEGLSWQVTVPANGSVNISYSTDLLLTQQ